MRIFITGDRSMPPGFALPAISVELLRRFAVTGSIGETLAVVTGDFPGVEEAVRMLAKAADVPLEILPETPLTDAGKPDFASRALFLAGQQLDKILVIHAEPMESKVYTSLIALPALEDKVELVSPVVVMVAEV